MRHAGQQLKGGIQAPETAPAKDEGIGFRGNGGFGGRHVAGPCEQTQEKQKETFHLGENLGEDGLFRNSAGRGDSPLLGVAALKRSESVASFRPQA
jgi:hypothetical protein